MYLYQKSADRMADKIAEAYREAANHINSEMEKIFRTFRENGGLTVKEAKEMLNERPTMIRIQNLREYAKQIKDPQKRQAVLNMLNAPAYAYRLERLERLQEDIDRQTRELAEFEQKATGQHYIDLAKRAYSRSMFDLQCGTGFLFPFPRMSAGRVLEILNYNWSGVAFSARIWGRSQEVNRAIREELLVQFMSNRSYRDTAREIERRMAVGAYEARRLVRTESTNIANMAEIESYRESGIQKFRFSAVLDMRTSEICASLDGKTFELEEAQTGVNVPPMHPFCRSSTVAVIDGETAADLKRRARDPKTGETYLVPADMTYRDWKKSIDEKYGAGTWDTERRKTVNRGSDKRQYEKYQNVLGRKNLPKSFDKFQELKYNDKEGWEDLKYYYRNINGRPIEYVKIDRELEKQGITNKGKAYPVEDIEIKGWREHAENRLIERNISKDEVLAYKRNAIVMMKRYPEPNTQFNYYSDNGMVGIKDVDKIVQTTYSKSNYKNDTIKMLEVVKKHVK